MLKEMGKHCEERLNVLQLSLASGSCREADPSHHGQNGRRTSQPWDVQYGALNAVLVHS